MNVNLFTPHSFSTSEYLVHAKCYHELADDYKRCAQVYYDNERQRLERVQTIKDISANSAEINRELRLWCW